MIVMSESLMVPFSLRRCVVFYSVYISAKDAESGLKSITTSIYDKTLKHSVWSETRPALTLQRADSRRKRVSFVSTATYNCFLFTNDKGRL